MYCDRVYIGANSRVVALDQETGDVVWRRDDLVPDDFPPCTNSPSACGGYIVVGFYGQPTNLMVLDAATGKTVWTKTEGKPYDIYSTPVIDEDGTIYTVSAGAVRAYDLETGALKWEAPFTLNRVRATPALAEGRLFVCTGSGTLHALEAGCGRELWRSGVHAGTRRCLPLTRVKGASRLHHRSWLETVSTLRRRTVIFMPWTQPRERVCGDTISKSPWLRPQPFPATAFGFGAATGLSTLLPRRNT